MRIPSCAALPPTSTSQATVQPKHLLSVEPSDQFLPRFGMALAEDDGNAETAVINIQHDHPKLWELLESCRRGEDDEDAELDAEVIESLQAIIAALEESHSHYGSSINGKSFSTVVQEAARNPDFAAMRTYWEILANTPERYLVHLGLLEPAPGLEEQIRTFATGFFDTKPLERRSYVGPFAHQRKVISSSADVVKALRKEFKGQQGADWILNELEKEWVNKSYSQSLTDNEALLRAISHILASASYKKMIDEPYGELHTLREILRVLQPLIDKAAWGNRSTYAGPNLVARHEGSAPRIITALEDRIHRYNGAAYKPEYFNSMAEVLRTLGNMTASYLPETVEATETALETHKPTLDGAAEDILRKAIWTPSDKPYDRRRNIDTLHTAIWYAGTHSDLDISNDTLMHSLFDFWERLPTFEIDDIQRADLQVHCIQMMRRLRQRAATEGAPLPFPEHAQSIINFLHPDADPGVVRAPDDGVNWRERDKQARELVNEILWIHGRIRESADEILEELLPGSTRQH